MIVTGHDRWVWLVVMMDVAMWGLDSRCGYMVGVAVVLGGHDRWVWQLCWVVMIGGCGYMVGVAIWWVWQLCWVVMIGGCGSCAVRLYFVVW